MFDCQEEANELYKGWALAPMVRASTTPLRTLALKYGADFVYTEEMVDRSVTSTHRIVNDNMGTIDYVKDTSKLSKKILKKLAKENRPCLILRLDPQLETKIPIQLDPTSTDTTTKEVVDTNNNGDDNDNYSVVKTYKTKNKVVGQLGSGEPELALAAAKHIYQDMASIDINMGCPKKFSVSGGMGSALLKDPDRASRILKTLKQEIPKPISCKIRLLETTQQTLDFIEGMINTGHANAIAIHARRVGHDAVHDADWATLKEVLGLLRPKYPTFPFLINGDFYNRKECHDMLETTKANGVLLGRPALYNTSIFQKDLSIPLIDKTTVIQDYLRHCIRYDIHYKNSKYVICEMMNNRRTPTSRVPYLPQTYPGGQTIAKTCSCNSLEQMCKVWDIQHSSVTVGGPGADGSKEKMQYFQLNAGEHRYEDSYFLKRRGAEVDKSTSDKTTATTNELTSDEPKSKRIRLGEEEKKENNTDAKDKAPSDNKAPTKDALDSQEATNTQTTQ